MASSSSAPEQEMRMVVYNGTPTVNGVLNPVPISSYSQPIRKNRGRQNKTRLVMEKSCFGELFQCNKTEAYILVLTEKLDQEKKTYYALSPFEVDGGKKIRAKEIAIGDRVISPVDGEIYRDELKNKTSLSIEQRLEGKWICQLRERNSFRKFEWIYYHEKMSGCFRSMVEVATFIAYNDTKNRKLGA